MNLSESEREKIKETLKQARADVEAHIKHLGEFSRPVSLDNPIGRVTRADAMQRQQGALAALNRERERLEKIVRAMSRVDQPDFGDCASCRKPIAIDRLQYYPETTLCVNCAR